MHIRRIFDSILSIAVFAAVPVDCPAVSVESTSVDGSGMYWAGVVVLIIVCACLLVSERKKRRAAEHEAARALQETVDQSSLHACELKEKSNLAELAFELGNAGFWYKDVASGCLVMSERARKIVGDSPHPDDPFVWTVDEWYTAARNADEDKGLKAKEHFHALEHKNAPQYTSAYPFQKADGTIIWINDKAVLVTHEVSGKQQIQGVVQDISAYKGIEKALDEALLKALGQSRAKDVFLANMSHELRTPLNGILGISSLLLGMSSDPAQQGYIRAIDASGRILLHVLNDILDFTSIEAGSLELQRSEFDLRHLVQQYIDPLKAGASAKCVSFTCEIDDDVPSHVIGDAGRIGQVLYNLAENAVKFTDLGGIHLHVGLGAPARSTVFRHGEDFVNVCFTLKDTGIGIAQEKMENLYKPFSQGDVSHSRRHGGSGLGLAISKRLAHLLGGALEVESTEGAGSCFTFNVLLEKCPEVVAEAGRDFDLAEIAQTLYGARVLLAEDNEINQMVTCDLLAQLGVQVSLACNGREAISLARDEAYDLVLMDIQMPEMDGIEATAHIRQTSSAEELPIIAMTAHALVGDREKSLAVGMNDHLTKPVDPQALYSTMAYWLKRRAKT